MVRPIVSLLTLVALAGCSGGDDRSTASQAAPPQAVARIAAARLIPGEPQTAVFTVEDDGSEPRVLVQAPYGTLERVGSPAWSPDAKRVYFLGVLGEREGDRFVYYETDVFVVDVDGGDPRRVTSSGDVYAVAPSPDGTTLLVARDEHPGRRPFTSGLWLVDGDGSNARRLVDAKEGVLDLVPSWSPDGRTIAFARCRFSPPGDMGLVENTCAVYTVSSDGSDLRQLAEQSSQPAFAPDGRQIAFVSDRDEHGQFATGEDENAFANELYVMDVDGSRQRRLTRTEGLDEAAPSWSPDGSRIAYQRQGPARFKEQLMIVNADGTCPTVLLGDATDGSLRSPEFSTPAWRPGRVTGELAPLDCD